MTMAGCRPVVKWRTLTRVYGWKMTHCNQSWKPSSFLGLWFHVFLFAKKHDPAKLDDFADFMIISRLFPDFSCSSYVSIGSGALMPEVMRGSCWTRTNTLKAAWFDAGCMGQRESGQGQLRVVGTGAQLHGLMFGFDDIKNKSLTVVRIMTTIVATSRNKPNDQLFCTILIVLEVSNSNHNTCHPTRTYTFRGVSKISHGIGQEWEKLSSSWNFDFQYPDRIGRSSAKECFEHGLYSKMAFCKGKMMMMMMMKRLIWGTLFSDKLKM